MQCTQTIDGNFRLRLAKQGGMTYLFFTLQQNRDTYYKSSVLNSMYPS